MSREKCGGICRYFEGENLEKRKIFAEEKEGLKIEQIGGIINLGAY